MYSSSFGTGYLEMLVRGPPVHGMVVYLLNPLDANMKECHIFEILRCFCVCVVFPCTVMVKIYSQMYFKFLTCYYEVSRPRIIVRRF